MYSGAIHSIMTSLPIPNKVKIEEPVYDIERIHQFDKGLVIDNGKLRGHLRFCKKVVMIGTGNTSSDYIPCYRCIHLMYEIGKGGSQGFPSIWWLEQLE